VPDRLVALGEHPLGRRLLRAVGLPVPVRLARAEEAPSARPLDGRVAALGDGPAAGTVRSLLERAGARLAGTGAARCDILVLDATGYESPADLRGAYDFFHPRIGRLARNARIVILAPAPSDLASPLERAVGRGLEGFGRSLGKEVGRFGAVVNLLAVERAALDRLDGPLRFFAGARSTYVGGQSVRLSAQVPAPPPGHRFADRVALVTGAARGIGAATAARLAQEGARVVCLDVPQASDALCTLARRLGGEALTLDIAAPDAAEALATEIRRRFGRIDVVVHNAGITRDRTLAKMAPEQWDQVVGVNLTAVVAIDTALLEAGLLGGFARLVYLSSISGIAGNFGQTNYAATKAALIGYVAALAARVAPRGICANAVAPGFIATPMTARIPFLIRQVGSRLNALAQAGSPRDVAELIAFLASPEAGGITGQTIRVCGQALVGA
jgi:3-oxoacyl-[acyl-carrier protein] reductase